MEPGSLVYRSPVYRQLQGLDAEFAEINAYAVAINIGEPAEQIAAARQLALGDLCGIARFGLKGPGTSRWLSEQGLIVPAENNRVQKQSDGVLIARLSAGEFLVLGDLDPQSHAVERLISAWQSAEDRPLEAQGFIVPRQDSHAWFRVSGSETAAALAKLCGVDLRAKSFDNLQVAQTPVARLNAIVIRDDIADVHAFHLLADSASAGYWWECLLDAGAEHDIVVVGFSAFQELNGG